MKLPLAPAFASALPFALALLAGSAWAHPVTTAFPAGATAMSAGELKSAVEGREFTAQPAEGPRWLLAYRPGGEFWVRAGRFADEGTWHTADGAVCTQGKKLKELCNAVRQKDGKLYLQRKGGEVMQLVPR